MWYKLVISFSLCLFMAGCHANKNKVSSVDRHLDYSPTVESFDGAYNPMKDVEKVYFEFDSSSLRSSDEKVLRKVVQKMQENPHSTLMLIGHTDSRGTEEYNMALGERRANSVKNFIIKCDPSLKSRIETQTKGKTEPEILVVGDEKSAENAAAHSKNRRVVISLDNSKGSSDYVTDSKVEVDAVGANLTL